MTEQQLGAVIAAAVKAAVAPAMERISALEAMLQIVSEKASALKQMDLAKQAEDLVARLVVLEATAPVPGPQGPAGERGEKGEAGGPGPAGDIGPQGLQGLPGAIGEKGLNGKDGRDGQPGVPGRQGDTGAAGLNGKDGADGLNGKDGTLDGLSVEQIDGRTWMLNHSDGVPVKNGLLHFDVPLDAGVYVTGQAYAKGDAVTFGGSTFFAQRATTDRPETSDAWRLAVKRGRDGKDGKDGKNGLDGKDGKDRIVR